MEKSLVTPATAKPQGDFYVTSGSAGPPVQDCSQTVVSTSHLFRNSAVQELRKFKALFVAMSRVDSSSQGWFPCWSGLLQTQNPGHQCILCSAIMAELPRTTRGVNSPSLFCWAAFYYATIVLTTFSKHFSCEYAWLNPVHSSYPAHRNVHRDVKRQLSPFSKSSIWFSFCTCHQLLLENNQPHLLSCCPLLMLGVTVWSAQKVNATPLAFKVIVLMILIFRAPEPVKINPESVF